MTFVRRPGAPAPCLPPSELYPLPLIKPGQPALRSSKLGRGSANFGLWRGVAALEGLGGMTEPEELTIAKTLVGVSGPILDQADVLDGP